MPQKLPEKLWIVRHGGSAGNVARSAAEAASLPMIDLATRDCDVPLSPLGERQADALGRWFVAHRAEVRPTVILSSPYKRAWDTAQRIAYGLGTEPGFEAPTVVHDERLREREFGILDRLTKVGILARHPEQAELRALIGKFYHRPPGGESWCDIILRLRSVLDTLSLEYPNDRVLIVCHSVVVLCFRYLLEKMTEAQILEIDRAEEVANCSVTHYIWEAKRPPTGDLRLETFNFVAPLEVAGERVTMAPDAPVKPK